MPKPAAPPPQVSGRYSELEEKIRKLNERRMSANPIDSAQANNQIQIAESEMGKIDNQFGITSSPTKRLKIVAEPMEFSAEEILEEQSIPVPRSRPMSKRPKKRIGRTVASRYNKTYKSKTKTKRDY